MGLTDKISGRVKQAAGDLLGNEDLQRQGRQEERKADAEAELAREEERLEREARTAEAEQEAARLRAAEAAQREFERAQARSDAAEERVEAQAARADRKAAELDELERRTDPGALADEHTKDELLDQARELDVEGRSTMTKDELAEEIQRRS